MSELFKSLQQFSADSSRQMPGAQDPLQEARRKATQPFSRARAATPHSHHRRADRRDDLRRGLLPRRTRAPGIPVPAGIVMRSPHRPLAISQEWLKPEPIQMLYRFTEPPIPAPVSSLSASLPLGK